MSRDCSYACGAHCSAAARNNRCAAVRRRDRSRPAARNSAAATAISHASGVGIAASATVIATGMPKVARAVLRKTTAQAAHRNVPWNEHPNAPRSVLRRSVQQRQRLQLTPHRHQPEPHNRRRGWGPQAEDRRNVTTAKATVAVAVHVAAAVAGAAVAVTKGVLMQEIVRPRTVTRIPSPISYPAGNPVTWNLLNRMPAQLRNSMRTDRKSVV